MTGIAPLEASLPSFEQLHTLRPNHFRKGDANEWRSGLSAAQLKRILRVHGNELAAAGFE
jgi:hypothetical protein